MDAKSRIENLINTWYGFALFNGVLTLFLNGIGVFSVIGAVFSFFVSLCITFVLGRLLLRKSSLTRILLIVVSLVGAVLGIVGIGGSLYQLVTEWSFSFLVYAGYAAIGTYMHTKSFRALTDRSVRAYFA